MYRNPTNSLVALRRNILLFACAVTRGFHLELVNHMPTEAFLLAFFRFAARPGLPGVVCFDNEETSKRAAKGLCSMDDAVNHPNIQNCCANHRISCKFIAEQEAWWRDFWKRMARFPEACLRKTLGKCRFDYDQLYTILREVEAVINSRLVAFADDSHIDTAVLTRALLICGK